MADVTARRLSFLISGIVSFVICYILSNALESTTGPLINIIYAAPIGAALALILDVLGVLDSLIDAIDLIRKA